MSSLPKLKQLRIDLKSPANAKTLLTHLPMLEVLNDKQLQPIIHKNENALETLSDNVNFVSEIENYNNIIERLSKIENNIGEKFKNFINEQMKKVDELIQLNMENYAYSCNVLKIKCEMYSFLQREVVEMIKNNYNQEENVKMLLDILIEICNIIKDKENEMINIINLHYNNTLKEKEKTLECDTSSPLSSNQRENEILMKENCNLKSILREQTKSTSRLEEDYKLLQIKCDKLINENIIVTNQLINKARTITYNNSGNILNKSPSPNKDINQTMSVKNKSFIQNTPLYSKQISKEALLELIDDIYKSKLNANAKCSQMKQPFETMEQHLYRFLNNKYGLKNITIDVASKVIAGIKTYSKSNSEICMFGMILRNELEENAINISNQIKIIIEEALTYLLKNVHKFKDLGEINELVSKIKKGYIDEVIWVNIIELIFVKDKTACETLKKKIYDYIEKLLSKSLNKMNREKNKLTREERELMEEIKSYQRKIKYDDLFNIILEYHLRTRDKYLKNLKEAFKRCDHDNNGILSKEQFYQLVIDLGIFENNHLLDTNIDTLVGLLPNCESNDSFSFSEIVNLFEKEIIYPKNENKGITILDYVSNK